MAIVFTLPIQSYPSGNTPFGPANVPVGVTLIVVKIDAALMTDPATSFYIKTEISFDGGTNWELLIGGGRPGGAFLDRFGNPIVNFALNIPVAQPTNANRRLRGNLNVVGPITVGGTVDIS